MNEEIKEDEEVIDYKHKYLHLLADSENARKRLQKEREEIMQYALKSIILDFLHPIDHLESALKYTDDAAPEVKHWASGFKMILGQFKDVLANNRVTPIDAEGKEFDPHLHEAIEMVESDEYPAGTIIEEKSKGYKMGDKTLRPARVKVSKLKEKEENSHEQQTEK